ncbi:MAG: glycosyltransferase [Lachnospiraceae bacterium]
MRIVVNDIAASTTGALSILKDFYRYVAAQDSPHEWIFLLGDSYIEETERIQVRILSDVKKSWLSRLKFDLFTGTSYIRALKPDIVFSLQNTLTRGYRGKQVVYVHQPLGFQKWKRFSFLKPKEREYAVYQYLIGAMIDSAVKRADKTIVQTQWMREAVIKKTHVSPEKVVKIMPDVECPDVKLSGNGPDRRRFFFPSGDILYKNHACIAEAAKLLNQKGITDFEVALTLTQREADGCINYDNRYQNMSYRGRISREEVYRLYGERILIFPSYIETFGYPPAEARQTGTVIFASDCPFCREVLAGYENAYYFDPFQPKELAVLMERAIRGEMKWKELPELSVHKDSGSLQGQQGKNPCSWARVVKEVLSVG